MARRRAWLLLLSFLPEYYEGGIGSLLLVDCILLKAAYSPLVTSVSSLPHGYLAILAALCATFGTCLSIPALVWCEFVTISDANLVEGIPPISTAARGFGLVGYEKYENSCQPYDEGWDRFPDDLGSQHKAAGAFGILALCLGFVGMVVSWCICCVAFPQRFMKAWGITYSFTALFQSLPYYSWGPTFATIMIAQSAAALVWSLPHLSSGSVQPSAPSCPRLQG